MFTDADCSRKLLLTASKTRGHEAHTEETPLLLGQKKENFF